VLDLSKLEAGKVDVRPSRSRSARSSTTCA
jgi:hypothetical protein